MSVMPPTVEMLFLVLALIAIVFILPPMIGIGPKVNPATFVVMILTVTPVGQSQKVVPEDMSVMSLPHIAALPLVILMVMIVGIVELVQLME